MILIWSSPNVHLGRDAINSQNGEGSCSGGRELSAEGGEPNSFLTPLETGLCLRGSEFPPSQPSIFKCKCKNTFQNEQSAFGRQPLVK